MRLSPWLPLLPVSLALQLPFQLPFLRPSSSPDSPTVSSAPQPKRIAIVGAGPAGSSAAFFFSRAARQAGEDVEIVVFEKEGRVGGRTTTVQPYDDPELEPVEFGASIFVDANKNMMKAAKAFNLTLREDEPEALEGEDSVGIWDGKEFVFESSNWSWWNTAKMVWRYGVRAPLRARSLTKSAVSSFLSLYSPAFLAANAPAGHPAALLAQLNFTDLVAQDALGYLVGNGVDRRFAEEVVEAATRVNYGTDLGVIHAVGALVSLAGSGGTQIKGGNWQVFEKMVEHSNATVHYNTTVLAVSALPVSPPKYTLTTTTTSSALSAASSTFDAVFLALPPHSLPSLPASALAPPKTPYIPLHVTLFTTSSPHYAYPPPSSSSSHPPSMVLTSHEALRAGKLEARLPFNSVNYLRKIERERRDEWVVKVFSEGEMSLQDLEGFVGVGKVGWVKRRLFYAYPRLVTNPEFAPFELDENLYYPSAFEPFISTMDTQTLAARNVVGLLAEKWGWGGWGDGCSPEAEETETEGKEEGSGEEVWTWLC